MLVTLISSMGPFKISNQHKFKMVPIYGFCLHAKDTLEVPDTECPCIRENLNISGVPVLPENMIIMFFSKC